MRKKRKSGDGGFNIWRSYSDVMAGVLLLFILIMSLTLFQAQKSYDESIQERDEKLALQAEYTADLLAKQNTIEEQEGTIKTKDEKLTALAQTLAEQEAKLKEQQALLNQQQMDLPAVNFSRAVFAVGQNVFEVLRRAALRQHHKIALRVRISRPDFRLRQKFQRIQII